MAKSGDHGLDIRLSELAAEIAAEARRMTQDDAFYGWALLRLAELWGAGAAAIAEAAGEQWKIWSSVGSAGDWPKHLAAEALDRERLCRHERWYAWPPDVRRLPNVILLADLGRSAAAEHERLLEIGGRLLAEAILDRRFRHAQRRRIQRLETLLDITRRWNKTQEMDQLLVEIATASTHLLAAERASIFLWDRANQELVARPALGVEGGELRIPDDVGVVGQVIRNGEPQRINESDDLGRIDRQVDQQLGYRTRSVLCVPLRSRHRELLGAFELINKLDGHFTADDEEALIELADHAAIALENTQQRERLLRSQAHWVDQATQDAQLIGRCPATEALRGTIRRVADTELAVLILGENGTGKEIVARCIHYLSRRRAEPFVAVNCAALPESLLESELFGHEQGAFTDARERRIGKFESASGGTLFLDEIGDMSLSGQAKLLRVLEEKIVTRLGGSTPIHTDTRVIAATNQNLANMVQARSFREDLYYRLNVVTLELPPLRERGEDVLLLAEHFLNQFCVQAGRTVPKLTDDAKQRLLRHAWPGNVRELRNSMERIAYMSASDQVSADQLAFVSSPRGEGDMDTWETLPLTEATRRFQRRYIERLVKRSRGNMSEAANLLGLHRSNLYRKMRHLGMAPSDVKQLEDVAGGSADDSI